MRHGGHTSEGEQVPLDIRLRAWMRSEREKVARRFIVMQGLSIEAGGARAVSCPPSRVPDSARDRDQTHE